VHDDLHAAGCLLHATAVMAHSCSGRPAHNCCPVLRLLVCLPCSEERIAQLAELAPWRLCANERQMTLPPEAAAKLPWGLLAGGSWWHRRPARWLKVRQCSGMLTSPLVWALPRAARQAA
jgi:hypothetical protein